MLYKMYSVINNYLPTLYCKFYCKYIRISQQLPSIFVFFCPEHNSVVGYTLEIDFLNITNEFVNSIQQKGNAHYLQSILTPLSTCVFVYYI